MAALLSQLPNGASNQVNSLFSLSPPASMIIPTSDSGFPPTFQTLDDVMTSSSSAAMSTSMSGSFYGEPIGVPEGADPDTLDLSGQNLEKLSRAAPSCQLDTTTLIWRSTCGRASFPSPRQSAPQCPTRICAMASRCRHT